MGPTPSEEQKAVYRVAFVRKCLLLVVRGHRKLGTDSLRTAEEPHITGELVKCIGRLLESDDAEPWMEHFEALDDPPQNVPDRFGKKRPRIDIEFVQTRRGRRPRFDLEAKRLYRSDSVSEYFGNGGLRMFITGVYALDQPSAGMLGYVQTDNAGVWNQRLQDGFETRRDQLAVCSDRSTWAQSGWDGETLGTVQITCHNRGSLSSGKLEIYHMLLEFL